MRAASRRLARVGVEVGVLGPARAGVARYVWNMIGEMMRAAPEVEFVLYAPWFVDIPLPPGNWRLREPAGRFRRVFELWVQEDLPRLLAADGIDLFWGQGFVVPHRPSGCCIRVLTVHDLTSKLFPQSMEMHTRLSYGGLLALSARAADRVVAVSEATARLVRLLLGVSRERVSVIYEGVDQSLKPPGRHRALTLVSQRFGISGDFVLCVGTIEPRKNIPTLLDALALMDRPPMLVLAGAPGWRCGDIMTAIREREKSGVLRYVGTVTDEQLAALYGAARLMVYPSVYEGFGLPVLEAMACGCPVLCSWSSSLPEVGGRAVRYFRPRDPGDLAAGMSALLRSPDELARMSSEGLVRATNFSFAKAAHEMLSMWKKLVSR